jgi:hypothetical protein
MEKASTVVKDAEPIQLKQIAEKLDEAIGLNKFTTVIDNTGGAETFLKYRGSTEFALSEKDMTAEAIGEKFLKCHIYGTMWTIHFTDLPYKNIFDSKYFPEDVLNPQWGLKFENIDKLRANFGTKFPEMQANHKDFRIVFIFYKGENIPDNLWQKTNVIQVFSPEDYESAKTKREEALAAAKKNVEETKVDSKDVKAAPKENKTAGAKTVSTTSKTTTTAKSTTSSGSSGAKTTGTTNKTTTTTAKPVTVSKPATNKTTKK